MYRIVFAVTAVLWASLAIAQLGPGAGVPIGPAASGGGSSGGGSTTITAGSTPTSGITSGDIIGSSGNLVVDPGIPYATLPQTDVGSNYWWGGTEPTSTGTFNIGIGRQVFSAATIGQANTCIGDRACKSLTSGSENIGIGQNSLLNATATGNSNIAIGVGSMEGNSGAITGYENTAIGNAALNGITTGIGNLVLGYDGASGAGNGYTSSEQGNILLNCTGAAGESNKVRICEGYTNTLLLDYGVTNSGQWTGDFALANGSTATTQVSTDNSGKVATDAFVQSITPTFSSYTPTMGCGGGAATWGTPTAVFNQFGKIVHVSIQVTMTSIATCNTGITFTLPITANSGQHWTFGGEIAAGSSYSLYCDIGDVSSSTVECFKYDGTVPGGLNNVFVMTGWYRSN